MFKKRNNIAQSRITISICLNVTMFGTAVVFLLLASKNIESFIMFFLEEKIPFCYIIIIVAIAILPLTLLKSPKDFWYALQFWNFIFRVNSIFDIFLRWIVICAMVTTLFAVGLILYGTSLDYETCSSNSNYPPVTPSRF